MCWPQRAEWEWTIGYPPFNLSADAVDDLVWEADNVAMAQVDCDAGLLVG
jgi:hypothetical protein